MITLPHIQKSVSQPPVRVESMDIQNKFADLALQSIREVRLLRIQLDDLLRNVGDVNTEIDGDPLTRQVDFSRFRSNIASEDQAIDKTQDSQVFGDSFIKSRPRSSMSAAMKLLSIARYMMFNLKNLDSLAGRMNSARKFGSFIPLNLLSTMEGLEFPPSVGQSMTECDQSLRRIDWISGGVDSAKWLRRTINRKYPIINSLASCFLFRRTMNVSLPEGDTELDHLRAELNRLSSDHSGEMALSFILPGPPSRNPILYVKVGNVMHCLITFRLLHPENIIIRGLDESHCLRSCCAGLYSSTPEPAGDSGQSTYQCPDIDVAALDISTASRYALFRRISDFANCAILHYSSGYSESRCLRSLLGWLNSYRSLYSAACSRCGKLLGHEASLPTWRSYTNQLQGGATNELEAQHEHCMDV